MEYGPQAEHRHWSYGFHCIIAIRDSPTKVSAVADIDQYASQRECLAAGRDYDQAQRLILSWKNLSYSLHWSIVRLDDDGSTKSK